MVRVRVLPLLAASDREDVRGAELLGERGGLARVRDEEDLGVPPLGAHLRQRVGDVLGQDLLLVLELEELVPAVAGEVDEDVAARVGEQALRPGGAGRVAVGQDAQERRGGDLVPAVVHLDVVAVEVDRVVDVAEDAPREGVARVARHVVREHQDDALVGDAEALDRAVEAQRVRDVAVVEPVPRRVHEHRPVRGVVRAHGRAREEGLGASLRGPWARGDRRGRDDEREEREDEEPHRERDPGAIAPRGLPHPEDPAGARWTTDAKVSRTCRRSRSDCIQATAS